MVEEEIYKNQEEEEEEEEGRGSYKEQEERGSMQTMTMTSTWTTMRTGADLSSSTWSMRSMVSMRSMRSMRKMVGESRATLPSLSLLQQHQVFYKTCLHLNRSMFKQFQLKDQFI